MNVSSDVQAIWEATQCETYNVQEAMVNSATMHRVHILIATLAELDVGMNKIFAKLSTDSQRRGTTVTVPTGRPDGAGAPANGGPKPRRLLLSRASEAGSRRRAPPARRAFRLGGARTAEARAPRKCHNDIGS